MSTSADLTFASHSQSVCQTTAFIGSGAARNRCRDCQAAGGFSDDLSSFMQVPASQVYAVSAQLTTIVTETGVGYAAPIARSVSPDSLMQLLQGLESEVAQLSGELGLGGGQSATSCVAQAPAGGLRGDYQTLYSEAVNAVQDGSAFNVTLASGETLSGKFSWSELEPVCGDSFGTPGDPQAPDAGRQAFDQAIAQFLALAQDDSGSASAGGQIANYGTTTAFAGGHSALSWSAMFSLAPADALPKS